MSDHSGTINHDTSEPNAKAVLYSVLGTVALFVVTVFAGMLYYLGSSSKELNDKELVGTPKELKELHESEDSQLNTGSIPISNAMEQVVREYRN